MELWNSGDWETGHVTGFGNAGEDLILAVPNKRTSSVEIMGQDGLILDTTITRMFLLILLKASSGLLLAKN